MLLKKIDEQKNALEAFLNGSRQRQCGDGFMLHFTMETLARISVFCWLLFYAPPCLLVTILCSAMFVGYYFMLCHVCWLLFYALPY